MLDTVAQANRTAGMPDAELVGRPALRGCSPRAGPRVGLWVQVQALWRPPRALPWDFVEKIEQRLVRKGQRQNLHKSLPFATTAQMSTSGGMPFLNRLGETTSLPRPSPYCPPKK